MIYKIQEIKKSKLEKIYKIFVKELELFFDLKLKNNYPLVIIVPDRKTIDNLRKTKTEDWVVGWADRKGVYLLSAKNYDKESNHKYSNKEYFALLKHELVHYFLAIASDFVRTPAWLSEGMAIFLSGQIKLKTKPIQYKKFIEFYDKGGSEIYKESGFAVEFLVKKYGKKKLILLIKKIKEVKSKKDFVKLFKSVYNFDLEYKNFKIL